MRGVPVSGQPAATAVPPLLVCAAVIPNQDKLLLAQRHPGDHLGGLWEFPGGKIGPGESPEAALVREIAEELGVRIAVERPLTFIHWSYPEKRILLLFELCRIIEGVPRAVECAAVGWFGLAELAGLPLAPADRQALAWLHW